MLIDREQIERMLPHRAPILLVESARIEQPGRSGRARARLPGGAALLGAIDSAQAFQELLLEAAAQAVGLVLGSAAPAPDRGKDERHLLLGFDDVRFGAGSAAAVVDIAVDVDEAGATASSARFRASQHGREVAQGRVMVMRGSA